MNRFLSLLLCALSPFIILCQGLNIYEGDISHGLKGYCITEIARGEKESIDLEVIGILEGNLVNQTYLLVRLLGERIEKYGVAAGMSGSPVYLEDKLLGAIAFTYSFQRENLAGVTLIRETIEQCSEIESLDLFLLDNISIESLDRELLIKNDLKRDSQFIMPVKGIYQSGRMTSFNEIPLSFKPIDIPSLSSKSSELVFQKNADIKPGDSFGVLLMKGDLEISAFGTITLVNEADNTAYALGHPVFSLGARNIPITKAKTVYTVPSNNLSFKVAENISIIGTMDAESEAGIKFSIGKEPDFIPFGINYETDKGSREFNFDLACFPLAVPSLYQNASFASIQNYIGTFTTRSVEAEVEFRGTGDTALRFRNIYDGFSSFSQYITEISNIISILLFNEFKEFPLESIQARVKIMKEIERYSLINCNISTKSPKQGEKIDINMLLASNRDNKIALKSEITIPDYFPDSRAMIIVCDYRSYIIFELMRNPERFSPKSYGELLRLIDEYPSANKIYIMLYSFSPSFSIDGQELNNLPVFYEKMMALDQSLVNKHNFSLQDLAVLEMDFAVSGGKFFPVEIFYR